MTAIQRLQTLSSLFCQLSSLFTIRSMQWDRVAKIPAVVALNVMASPLKSTPLISFGLEDWNTAREKLQLILGMRNKHTERPISYVVEMLDLIF